MEIKSKYESPLVLKKIEIVESSFKKTSDQLEGLELEVHVNRQVSRLNEEMYEVFLDTIVADEDEKLYVKVKCKAVFETSQKNEDMLEKNTIAIMFPYVRSYISIITTQPGMNPIVLPAINIVAMINDNKN